LTVEHYDSPDAWTSDKKPAARKDQELYDYYRSVVCQRLHKNWHEILLQFPDIREAHISLDNVLLSQPDRYFTVVKRHQREITTDATSIVPTLF
jgi:hypothetical protein